MRHEAPLWVSTSHQHAVERACHTLQHRQTVIVLEACLEPERPLSQEFLHSRPKPLLSVRLTPLPKRRRVVQHDVSAGLLSMQGQLLLELVVDVPCVYEQEIRFLNFIE